MEDPWADSAIGGESNNSSSTVPQSDDTAPAGSTTAPSTSSTLTPSTNTSSGRPSRLTPRRLVAQPTRLEAVEDDPLGPLGASTPAATNTPLAPPQPPLKEQLPLRTTLPGGPNQIGTGARRPGDPHRIEEEELYNDSPSGPRQPPPVPPAQPSSVRTSMQPSVSIEQAANPTFHIYVGDPHK
ncbi:Vacuolar protein sorting-associated protein vps5, partial [Neurospora sp. IMI 360204]